MTSILCVYDEPIVMVDGVGMSPPFAAAVVLPLWTKQQAAPVTSQDRKNNVPETGSLEINTSHYDRVDAWKLFLQHQRLQTKYISIPSYILM